MDRVTTTIEGIVTGGSLLYIGMPLVVFGIVAGYLAGLRDRLLLMPAAVSTAVGLLVVGSQVLGALGNHLGLAAWWPGFGKGNLPPQANDDIWHDHLTARLADLSSPATSVALTVLLLFVTVTVYLKFRDLETQATTLSRCLALARAVAGLPITAAGVAEVTRAASADDAG